MRVFLTGVAGFIGSNLAEALLREGHEVFGLDDLSGGFEENVPVGVAWLKVPCSQIDRMWPGNVDVLYHCAAAPYEGVSSFSPSYIAANILQNSVDTFSCAIKRGVGRIVHCSSMARYGKGDGGPPPFTEDRHRPAPVDPYGVCKVAAEDVLGALCGVHKVDYTIAVPHNVYGPRQDYSTPYRNVAAIFINRLLQGKPPIIYGDGEQRRCFTYIDDAVDCLVKMATQTNVLSEIINIGPDEEFVSINRLARMLIRLTGVQMTPMHVPDRPAEVDEAYCSSNKARRLLGYETRTSLLDGMAKFVEWVRERGPRGFRYHLPLEIINEHTPKTWVNEEI